MYFWIQLNYNLLYDDLIPLDQENGKSYTISKKRTSKK